MARIRTIKPEFFTSEDIVSLTPLARLFYVSLWCESDREGRLVWKPKTLKLRYFPADNCEIQDLANELLSNGMIHLYIVDGVEYAFLPAFTKHQIINNRESTSTLPAPPFAQGLRINNDASGTRESADFDDAEGKGKEGKGRERKGKERKSYDSDVRFSAFWDEYPNKKGKAVAETAWQKLSPDEVLFAEIMHGLKMAKASRDWLKDDGQFVPHPSTWLNQKRWMDVHEAPPSKHLDPLQAQIIDGVDPDELAALMETKRKVEANHVGR